MHVILRVGRRVDMYDKAHVVDVDSTRGNVRGDEDRRAALLELGDRPVAGVLRLTAVQGAGGDTLPPQHRDQPVDAVLRADEQDRAGVASRDLGDHRGFAALSTTRRWWSIVSTCAVDEATARVTGSCE